MRKVQRSFILVFVAWSWATGSANADITVTADPASFVVAVGQSVSSTLSATDSNPPASGTATWKYEVDDPWSIAGNTFTAVLSDAGDFTITVRAYVSYDGGTTWSEPGTTTITVTAISVTFSPDPVNVAVGGTASLTASYTPAAGSCYVSYNMVSTSIATWSGVAPDLSVTGVSAGQTQIQAIVNGQVCATATVNSISATFSPSPFYVWKDTSDLLSVTVTPSDSAGDVQFSADPAIATVLGGAPTITVIGVSAAQTTLVAKVGDDTCGSVDLYIVDVSFSPDPLYVGKGNTAPLTATVTPSGAASQLTFDTADATIATVTGTPPNLTVTGVGAGTTQVRCSMTGTVRKTSDVTVFKVEITDNGGTVLASVVDTERVAVRTQLKAKVTPTGLTGLTYQWSVDGQYIKTYKHDIDEASKHNPISLAAADYQNDNISFYWQEENDDMQVQVTVTKGSTNTQGSVLFDVTQAGDPADPTAPRDPNKYVYATTAPSEKTNPNDIGNFYDLLTAHSNWHSGDKMDNNDVPVESATEGGGADTWGDGDMGTKLYNGRAFLKWHRAFMDAHLAWRSTFNQGGVGGAATGAIDPPEYLKGTPSVTSTDKSVTYNYVRLGEFQNIYQLGRDVVDPWHNDGHGAIATASGDGNMNNPATSPATKDNLFWRWHTTVDTMQVATDQANPILLTPADGANLAAKTTTILVVFDKRVSNSGADNTIKITKEALKINGVATATALDDVGGGASKFMAYQFTIPAQPAGVVNVELVGTASFKGKTWSYTTP